MTLNNKNWLKNEIFRLYLSGDSQENIASQLNISVGTVNNFVSELSKSDDTVDLQHQIDIVKEKWSRH
jgi:DNA-binding transcriptional regulator LsrR (DeoR family)